MRWFVVLVGITSMLWFAGCTGRGDERFSPTIRFSVENDAQHVELSGLPDLRAWPLSDAEWRSVFPVSVEGAEQPMLGTYAIDQASVRFTPAFPFAEGQAFQATFSPDAFLERWPDSARTVAGLPAVTQSFTMPIATADATTVTDIFPTGDQLPSNLLRFYVYFSGPMREGEALTHVALVDADGNEVEGVFFDPVFELWDRSNTRLTLLFDPGRVKTGLRAHEELGRALVPGQTYTLIIRDSMLDANGNRLERPVQKSFQAVDPDLSPPDVTVWEVSPPNPGGRDPLVIDFPAALDHQLLTEFVQIRDAQGAKLNGTIVVSGQETEWQFIPDSAWREGEYQLWVNTKLEDIAGNNLHGLFDTPPEERVLYEGETDVRLTFEVE